MSIETLFAITIGLNLSVLVVLFRNHHFTGLDIHAIKRKTDYMEKDVMESRNSLSEIKRSLYVFKENTKKVTDNLHIAANSYKEMNKKIAGIREILPDVKQRLMRIEKEIFHASHNIAQIRTTQFEAHGPKLSKIGDQVDNIKNSTTELKEFNTMLLEALDKFYKEELKKTTKKKTTRRKK